MILYSQSSQSQKIANTYRVHGKATLKNIPRYLWYENVQLTSTTDFNVNRAAIAKPGAGGVGSDLTRANKLVYTLGSQVFKCHLFCFGFLIHSNDDT